MSDQRAPATDIRQQIRDCVQHLEHVLPGQAPIRDFVHHNTLHGFQHLSFSQALAEARRVTGNRGYLPPERFRAYLAEGRIGRDDLLAVIDEAAELEPDRVLLDRSGDPDKEREPLRRRDLYLAALCHPIGPIPAAQLNWRIDEEGALRALQPDLEQTMRQRLLATAESGSGASDESRVVGELWSACVAALSLEYVAPHPEELIDLSPEQAERSLEGRIGEGDGNAGNVPDLIARRIGMDAVQRLQDLLDRLGAESTLRDLLRELTGEDLLIQIRPQLIRHLSNFLDEGFAPWRNPAEHQGLYRAWRATAVGDLVPMFRDLQASGSESASLPENPLEAIVTELERRGLPQERWVPYLERLALEVPGWSGMVLWRHLHPDYRRGQVPVSMLDYLAVRLVMERIYAKRLCWEQWQIEPNLDMLRWYFRRNPEELLARQALYSGRLPEFLAERAARTVTSSDLAAWAQDWRKVAAMIWAWQQGTTAGPALDRTLQDHAWPLFLLAQHLGLAAPDIQRLGPEAAAELLALLERLDDERSGHLWLCAFERHYREEILAALTRNHGRGRWRERVARGQAPLPLPSAQVVFCMDDREEGIRRHLEELDPSVETLGAAAHFSVPHNWRGLDDLEVTPLAPVIPTPVIPAHEVRECPRPESKALGTAHAKGHAWLHAWSQRLLERGRRGLAGTAAVTAAAGPFAGASLLGKLAAPVGFHALVDGLRSRVEPPVPTCIDFVAPNDSPAATPEAPRLGFTDTEQADRVQALLHSMGLTAGFAPLVVVLGHGSRNQNNPHASAYNCGACSGRFSGPNARLVSAMANRPTVRALLAERGTVIPERTWFIGGEHDTCNDTITWYDTEDLPAGFAPIFTGLRDTLDQAARLHAQERCRRFASATPGLDPAAAHRHVAARALDISQVRPELGHATNACAIFGRRSMSRGAFFDRRAFLISYDPTQDPDGAILERHLVINGAVGAGISLEYYFSAANDEGYGCGSKITHNVTGLLGVMDGAASDLRTGLPRQMVEIHEAMRLLVVVEQSTAVLTAIYRRQPAVAELVGGTWVQLAALDPETGAISLFRPGSGWVPWQPTTASTPKFPRSNQCYLGHSGPRPPALIMAPDAMGSEVPDHA